MDPTALARNLVGKQKAHRQSGPEATSCFSPGPFLRLQTHLVMFPVVLWSEAMYYPEGSKDAPSSTHSISILLPHSESHLLTCTRTLCHTDPPTNKTLQIHYKQTKNSTWWSRQYEVWG